MLEGRAGCSPRKQVEGVPEPKVQRGRNRTPFVLAAEEVRVGEGLIKFAAQKLSSQGKVDQFNLVIADQGASDSQAITSIRGNEGVPVALETVRI
jgi:hypothetical protein